jgi:hypothetical protein
MSVILITCLFLIILVFGFLRLVQRKGRTPAAAFFGILGFTGLLGFMGPVWIPEFGESLKNIELPNSIGATKVAADGVGVYVASVPLQRIQRYQPNGMFEMGWFVPASGGIFAVQAGADGMIEVCTARGRKLLIYSSDGQLRDTRNDCKYSEIASSTDHKIRQGILGWALVPLWHPIIGWLMVASMFFYKRRSNKAVDKS